MLAIKDMEELPKHCMTCQFHDQMYNLCNIGHFETGAKFIKGDDKWYFKHPNCPLVEIVTCKDCKYCFIDEDGHGYHCEKSDTERFPTCTDFYCVHAERRE